MSPSTSQHASDEEMRDIPDQITAETEQATVAMATPSPLMRTRSNRGTTSAIRAMYSEFPLDEGMHDDSSDGDYIA